jgi:ParB family transcriptional regulator, chromosome partitioning protein
MATAAHACHNREGSTPNRGPLMDRNPQTSGRLGRGLGSLLPSGSGVSEVDLDLIVPNPRQPRTTIAPDALAELAESVRAHGILQPLVVSRVVTPSGAVTYQLIAGERRLRAARAAGLTRAPVVVREATPQDLLELALIENVQRADLDPLEEAAAYRRLIDEFGLTQEAVARRVAKSRVTVANALRLLALPEAIRASLAAGEISEGHARALLGAPDDEARLRAWQETVAAGLTVRQTEELVRRLRDAPVEAAGTQPAAEPARARPSDPALADIEERMQRALGTQVRLERSRKGGRIVIRFYGDEDLNALIERLLGGLVD